MQALTLSIALTAGLFVFLLKPFWSVVIYIAVMAWYPSNLTIPVGTVDFTACRILIIVIFANIYFRTNSFECYRIIWLDIFILIYFVCQIISGIANIPLLFFLENRAGVFFDLVLPYASFRLLVRERSQYLTILKSIMVISIPLALFGLFQSVTGSNIAAHLKTHASWGGIASQSQDTRDLFGFSFFRDDVTFPQPIMFGLFFAMLGPVCIGLFSYLKKNRMLFYAGIGATCIGVFASMSSGPVSALFLSIAFIGFYKYRKCWKITVLSIFVMCVTVEIVSNRHFWELIDRFAYSGNSAWYRSRLIEVALFEGGMNDHWITGYGFKPLGWGPRIDGRQLSDVVNHYILILARYGLVGLVPFLCMVFIAIKMLIRAYKTSIYQADKFLIWCLGGAMFGVLFAINTVSLFGQPRTIFYLLLGFCAQTPILKKSSGSVTRRRRLNRGLSMGS